MHSSKDNRFILAIDSSQLPATVVADLSDLVPLQAIFRVLNPELERTVRQLLPKLPLLAMLKQLMSLVIASSSNIEQRALRQLMKHLVAKHSYTRSIYENTLRITNEQSPENLRSFTAHVSRKDAALVMEILALIADLLGEAGYYAPAVYTFEMQAAICENLGLPANLGIALHQRANFEWIVMGNQDEAAFLFQQAAPFFDKYLPEFSDLNNFNRITLYSQQLLTNPQLLLTNDLQRFVELNPLAHTKVKLVRLYNALEEDDLDEADQLVTFLDKLYTNEEESAFYQLLKARFARRKGEFEKADVLLSKAELIGKGTAVSEMLRWQRFYLERDQLSGNVQKHLPEENGPGLESSSVRILYQKGLLAYYKKDLQQADTLFREALTLADDTLDRANCLGMLGSILPGQIGRTYLYRALNLYWEIGKRLDYAISLSHLADKEIEEATAMRELGYPTEFLYQFKRAESILEWAEDIASQLGKNVFLIELKTQKGQLQMTRGAYHDSVQEFQSALSYVELVYLSFADQQKADSFFERWESLIQMSIRSAIDSGQPDIALSIVEKVKGRRWLRNLMEMQMAEGVGRSSDVTNQRELLQKIRHLRQTALRGQALSVQQRQTLLDAEEDLSALMKELQINQDQTDRGLLFGEQDVGQLWQSVFEGSTTETIPLNHKQPEKVSQEMVGGGVMRCQHCGIYNKITSTFCGICSEVLPKSAVFHLSVDHLTEKQWKEWKADGLYRQAETLFVMGEIQQAFGFVSQSLEVATSSTALFLKGLCLLNSSQPDFLGYMQTASENRYAEKYPFWTLPLSPRRLDYFLSELGRMDSDRNRTCEMISGEFRSFFGSNHQEYERKA